MITITIRKGNTRDGDGNTYSCQVQNFILNFCFLYLAYAVLWCVKVVWYPYTSWLDRTLNFIALNGTQLIFRPFFDLNFTSHVSFHVQGQMIRTWEAAITIAALEGFCSCVFAIMTCKLIAPCKSPFTALPRALVGLLTCNDRNS